MEGAPFSASLLLFVTLCKQLSLVSSEAIMNTTAVQESPTNHLTSRYLVTSGRCKHNAADEE